MRNINPIIEELENEIDELEYIIKSSSSNEECIKAVDRITELEKKIARINRIQTEESIKEFYSRSQATHNNVKLDESLLPSDDNDDDSEGASASFGFHKRTGNECQF